MSTKILYCFLHHAAFFVLKITGHKADVSAMKSDKTAKSTIVSNDESGKSILHRNVMSLQPIAQHHQEIFSNTDHHTYFKTSVLKKSFNTSVCFIYPPVK